jgi:hypothetical protein
MVKQADEKMEEQLKQQSIFRRKRAKGDEDFRPIVFAHRNIPVKTKRFEASQLIQPFNCKREKTRKQSL